MKYAVIALVMISACNEEAPRSGRVTLRCPTLFLSVDLKGGTQHMLRDSTFYEVLGKDGVKYFAPTAACYLEQQP